MSQDLEVNSEDDLSQGQIMMMARVLEGMGENQMEIDLEMISEYDFIQKQLPMMEYDWEPKLYEQWKIIKDP